MKNSTASSTPSQLAGTDWEGLRSFAAFVEAGSLSGAARALGLTHATVGRRLRLLEEDLHGPLFTRRGEDIELTRLGEAVLGAARAMQDQASQLARTLAGDDLRLEGQVRLAATDALATMFLAPRLPQLLQRWPNLDIEFTLGHRNVSLARRDADLAVRAARPQDGELIARPLGRLVYYLCGTPALVEMWQQQRRQAPFVGYDDAIPDIPETQWHAAHARGNPVRLKSTSLVAQCMAARAGVGLALLPRYLIDGGLVLAEPEVQLERELWAVYHRDLRSLPRLRAVLEWLEQCCQAL